MARVKSMVPLAVRVRIRDTINRAIERSDLVEYATRYHCSKPMSFGPSDRLSFGPGTTLHNATLNLNSGRITLEKRVIFGHHVTVLTGTHDIERFGEDRDLASPTEGRDVLICEGAWVATNATILGPCTIGRHAVVAAGAVVTRDVADYTVVAGCLPSRSD